MGDCIKTKRMDVTIQENGIIRNAKTGRFLGRLEEDKEMNFEKLEENKGMEIKELIQESHENALKHGFWNEFNSLPTLGDDYLDKHGEKAAQAFISQFLMLIVSEVAEAQEGLRHNDMDNFKEELADTCIRIFDLCGGLDIDLESEIQKKMEINKSRPYKHGKEF